MILILIQLLVEQIKIMVGIIIVTWYEDEQLTEAEMQSGRELVEREGKIDLDYRRWAFGHFHADRLFPWNDGKQMLMLFNENVVDLKKFMEMKEGDSLQEILA